MAVKKGIFGALGIISIGVVLIFSHLFFMIGASTGYFGDGWFEKSVIYFLLVLGVFGWDIIATRDVERKLFNTSFIKKGVPIFALFFAISFGVLFFIGSILKPEILNQIQGLLTLSAGLVMFHAMIIAVDETLVFQTFIPEKLKGRVTLTIIYIISCLTFALFHYWTAGGQWLLLLPYIPLGAMFLKIRYKWGIMATAGVHFAYNLFILGFFV